ncbi:MAG: hypothetical protein ACOCRX_01000 [Candidatus Woesearchaeota archaeon]
MKSKLFIMFAMVLVLFSFSAYAESSIGIELWTGDTSFDLNHTEGNEVELFFNVTNATNVTECNALITPSDYQEISNSSFEFDGGNHTENFHLTDVEEGSYSYELLCNNGTVDFSQDITFDVNITNVPILMYDVFVDDNNLGQVNDFDFDENQTLVIELSSLNNPLVERTNSFNYQSEKLDSELLSNSTFNYSTDFESSENYSVNFTVLQEDGIDSEVVSFKVNDVNRPPYIEFLDGVKNKSITALPGDQVDEVFRFGDLDGDEIDISCSDSGRTTIINETHGRFNYEIGSYGTDRVITCNVTDNQYEEEIKLEVNVQFNRFNINLDDEDGLLFDQGSDSRDSRITKEITVTNNLDESIEVDIFADVDENYSFRFRYAGSNYDSLDNFPIDANSESTFEVSVIIPNDVSLSRKNIGDIEFIGEHDEFEFDVFVKPSSMLRFDRLDYDVLGEDSGRLRDGDDIDVRPNDEVEISVELINEFSEESDLWMEDVELFYTIEDIDDGDDISGSIYFNDIEAEEVETESFSFEIPTRLESGTYDVLLEIEGEDENRFIHEELFDFELDVSKDRDDLLLEEFSFDRENVGCLRYANLDLSLINIGRDDLEDWSYSIRSGSVDFSMSDEFDLDSYRRRRDDDHISFSEEVDFTGASVGEHEFELRVYDDRNRLQFLTSSAIFVDACDSDNDGDSDSDNDSSSDGGVDVIIDNPNGDEPDDKPVDDPDYIVDSSNDFSLVLLLGVLNLVLVVLLVLFLVKIRD